MTKRLRPLAVVVVLGFARAGAAQPEPPEVKVKLKDLPAAVQKAVQEQTAQARLKGLTKEIEDGQTFFEAELAIREADEALGSGFSRTCWRIRCASC